MIRFLKCKRGFTFIEVLVTLIFAGIVLPVTMRGIALATTAASESRKRSEATFLAHNMIAEIVSSEKFDFVSISGDFLPEQQDYTWTAELSAWEGETVKELVVQVFWKSRNHEQSVSLATLVYTGGGQ